MTRPSDPTRLVDPRDKAVAALISRYRKEHPGVAYHEAARAICFDPPWSDRLGAILGLVKGAIPVESGQGGDG